MTIGEKIVKLREEKGWSQYRLAKESGVGQAALSHIENGKRHSPTHETLQKLCRALKISMSEFDSENKNEAAKKLPLVLDKLKHLDLDENQKIAYEKLLSMNQDEQENTLVKAMELYKKINSLPPEGKQAVENIIDLLSRK